MTLEEMCKEIEEVNRERHITEERDQAGLKGRREAFCPCCRARVEIDQDYNGYPILKFLEYKS